MHIITNFSGTGGAERMLARLLHIAEDKQLVAPIMGVSEQNRELVDNPRVIYAPQEAGSLPKVVSATVALARLIREAQPKAVVCWMYHAMVVGTVAGLIARTRTPVFWNVRQSLDDPASLTASTRLALRLGRYLSGYPNGIIYNSARARQLHGRYGYCDTRATVIPNGFELPTLNSPTPGTPCTLGIAGRFHPQKDHETFFRAAAQTAKTHPRARFIAAGLGLTFDNPRIRTLIEETGLAPERVKLRGEVRDMESFYREIDALVLSSRTEGFPNVAAEAMSYGKPVVTTDVGDAAAIVGDTGFTVPPRDTNALAEGMRSMLDLTPAAYAARARAARRRIEVEYAMPAIAEKYRAFIDAKGMCNGQNTGV